MKNYKFRLGFLVLGISMLFLFLCSVGVAERNDLRSGAADQIETTVLYAQFADFIEENNANGTMQTWVDYWYAHAEDGKVLDYSALKGENGTVRMGTKTCLPFAFIKDGQWTGISIEVAFHFCETYGYKLEIRDFGDINSIILATQSGKVDMGGAAISITEERKQLVDYSPSYYDNSIVFIVPKDVQPQITDLSQFEGKHIGTITGGLGTGLLKRQYESVRISEFNSYADLCLAVSEGKIEAGLTDESVLRLYVQKYDNLALSLPLVSDDRFGFVFAKGAAEPAASDDEAVQNITGFSGLILSLQASIERTFIRENRWMLILTGIGNTMLITVLSIVFGTFFGFLGCLVIRKKRTVADKLIRFVVKLIDALPTVVLLMILFYVIFGKSSIDSVTVSVIAFTLIFASAVLAMLQNAVSAIDRGQYEVSSALGYSENQTYYKMILPQAIRFCWQPFRAAVRTQIKATAVVGYISAQDLTKAMDMVRSATYEPLFPLLSSAAIYFILTNLLLMLVNLIKVNTEPSPKRSRRFLKGVNLHD